MRGGQAAWGWVGLVWLLGCLVLLRPGIAHADVSVAIDPLRMTRSDDALAVSTAVRFDLPPAVADALAKGIAMHFVFEADLIQPRWYWTDKVLRTAVRTARLAYQPLTRRWRMNLYAGPPGEANPAQTFGQNFDSLDEAMAAVRRVSGWRIAPWSEVEPGSRQRVELRFRLDTGQLPRPLQIGTAGEPDWRISATRSQRLSLEDNP